MLSLRRLSPTTQGYFLVLLTMVIWGGFSLMSRLIVHWGMVIWDVIAIRFLLAALIVLPIVIYQRQYQYLIHPRAIVLAITGGVGYSCLVYSAFGIAPVVHGAVFLNGMIPVATAVITVVIMGRRLDIHTKIALGMIGLTILCMCLIMIHDGLSLGAGDVLFLLCAFCWATYSILIREWNYRPWQVVASTVLWSALIYLPSYALFATPQFEHVTIIHLLTQGLFHSVIVMIIASLSYAMAVIRLGAFFAGGLSSIAPFLSAFIAVPLLGEPLNLVMLVGLIGMGLGTVQPWRFFTNKENK